MKKVLVIFLLMGLVIFGVTSCKKTYFSIAEEINENIAIKYTISTSYYMMGKAIELTRGKFHVVPGDSIVLFVEGKSTKSPVGNESVAQMQLAKTARFYATMPVRLDVGEYVITHKSICEMMGSLNYGPGENLFTCQSGKVVIDSLKGEEIFGSITGTYRNTKNQSLRVDGLVRAKLH